MNTLSQVTGYLNYWVSMNKLGPFTIKKLFLNFKKLNGRLLNKINHEFFQERNRRVAKAYARAPVITVNGSDDGFDGFRIGLSGFDNPMRDPKTEEVKRLIGQVIVSNTILCEFDLSFTNIG